MTNISKLSFQYGLRVFLITLVVCVCSESTVITANGSGRRKTSRLAKPSAATTLYVSFFENTEMWKVQLTRDLNFPPGWIKSARKASNFRMGSRLPENCRHEG
jgi:hypothetical protein